VGLAAKENALQLPDQLTVVDTHTAGEPTRIWIGGLYGIPGATMAERRIWLRDNYDHLRRFLVQEPRGHRGMSGAIVGPPCDPSADVGVVYMDNYRYMPMCGHATIGVVTALVEMGHLNACGGSGELVLDTPAGTVSVVYREEGGRVRDVTFRNVCSYHIVRSCLEVTSIGAVEYDIAFGGMHFVLVSVDQVPLEITPRSLPELRDTATAILREVDHQGGVVDPIGGQRVRPMWLEFYDETRNPARNVVLGAPVSAPGEGLLRCNKVDRSPCGTGLSAKLATLHARGDLSVGDVYPYESIIGTCFLGIIAQTCSEGEVDGIIPEVRGSAHIIGTHTLLAGRNDPFPAGFLLPEG
jgi:proline racemase